MSLATTLPQAIRLNLLQQWRYFSRPVDIYAGLRKRHVDLAVFHFQGRDYIGILTPEGIRQVFSADPASYDVFWKESFASLSGNEVLWVLAGEKHQRARQMYSPPFHPSNFRGYGTAIRAITRLHIEQWQPGKIIRAIDTMETIFRDIIMRTVFGVEDGSFYEEGRKIQAKLWHAMHPLIVFFPALQRHWFPLWRRYTRAKDEFSNWVNRYLVERRAQRKESHDMLGHILTTRDEDGNLLSDSRICDEFISILGSGHETTATSLAWALYELGRNPEIMSRLLRELESIGAEADPSLVLTLPYLSAVCNETLRLHPILPECARVSVVPLEILGHTIPAGQALVISIVGIHHDPTLYPEPERFRPERFLERTYSVFEFLPFGGGHRRCLGAGFAEYILRIVLADIVLHWEFETAAVDRDVRHDIAMGPKHGVRLQIKGRRKPNIRLTGEGPPSKLTIVPRFVVGKV